MRAFIIISICLFSIKATAQSYFFVLLNTNYQREDLPKEKVDSLQAGHIANIKRLASLKKIIVAGPFNRGGGIFIFKAADTREVKDLLPDYLSLCREKGILEVRVIHGKGTGMLRETVHSILKRLPEVISFRLAGEDAGSWGATLVVLRPLE